MKSIVETDGAVQTPGNTPGMGPITPPTANTPGSGDNFTMSSAKKRKFMTLSNYVKQKKKNKSEEE